MFNRAEFKWPRLISSNLGAAYWKSLFFWNPLICFFFCLSVGQFQNFGEHFLLSDMISNLVLSFCFGVVMLGKFGVRSFSRRRNQHPLLHSKAWSFSLSFLAMPAGLYLAFAVMRRVAPIMGIEGPTANLDDYRFGLLFGTLIAGIFFLIETRSEARDAVKANELKLKAMENERLHAQISALTAQMNPHLLFNALNTVASLVPTDPQKAEDVILQLSDLYRGVLDSSRKMTHSLATELSICESYLAIEKARFGERLSSRIEVFGQHPSANLQIPALCLQPLVENSVKHGLAPRAMGGEIVIRIDTSQGHLEIFVDDNGVGLEAAKQNSSTRVRPGAGTGLRNCQERLRLHFGESSRFEMSPRPGGGTRVHLLMPLILTEEVS